MTADRDRMLAMAYLRRAQASFEADGALEACFRCLGAAASANPNDAALTRTIAAITRRVAAEQDRQRRRARAAIERATRGGG